MKSATIICVYCLFLCDAFTCYVKDLLDIIGSFLVLV